MQNKIKQAQKYLEWKKPNQAIAELKPTLESREIQQQFKWVPYHMMGIALSLKGEHEASAGYLEKSVKYGSKEPETHHMLSINYYNLARFDEAEKYGREAVARKEGFFKAWLNLGSIYRAQAKLDKALECYQKANQIDATNAGVAFRIGEIYRDQGDLDQAMKLFDITLKIDETHIRAMLEKADLYKNKGNLDEAIENLDQAEKMHGARTSIRVSKAEIYKSRGKYDDAIELYEKLLNKHPHSGALRVNYALCLQEVSRFDQSEKNYRRAIEDMQDPRNAISNYLMGLHYNPRNGKEHIYEEHLRLGKTFVPRNTEGRPRPSDADPNKKLKVGFLSGGFRRHPVGWMIAGALEQLPEKDFEIYCYTTNNKFDFVTRRIHENINTWRSVVGYNADVIENIIRDDELDIVVDLSGHAADNCMEVMANEPAPVIVKWVGGLFNTTGLEAFDYLITDEYESPAGEEEFYTEKLVRMPDDYISFVPPAYAPDVQSLPAKENGYITFGCFNNPTKVNDVVLRKWAQIMRQVPDSKLCLKSKQYDTASFRKQILEVMKEEDIAEDRVEFEGHTSHDDHLDAYNKVDIALDPWPYSGGLTTCEALYMGVPVITMPGPTFAGRHSTTHLMNAGLEQWVTDSWKEYTERTVALANDWDALQEWRSILRGKLCNSAVCDSKRFGAHLSIAFREMWRQRVEGYQNDEAEWKDHIRVDNLPQEQIQELTDGPDRTSLITIKEENKTEGSKKTDKNNMMKQPAIDTEKLVTNENGTHAKKQKTSGHSEKSLLNKNDYYIDTKDDVTICTPPDLDVLTTYVMLEQGQWFEPELDFVRDYLKSDMQVVDVGASFGAYALPMAKKVGREGNVFAFEPSAENRSYLEKSKTKNSFNQLEIIGRGLSDEIGKSALIQAETPELNTISEEGKEKVLLTTLDAWWNFAGQPQLNLLKVDANGMESKVLEGAKEVIDQLLPVILVSIGEKNNSLPMLRNSLQKINYRLFEYIPQLGVLVAHDSEVEVDPHLMNVIAIHESRIQEFKESGWIFDESVDVGDTDLYMWERYLEKMPWAKKQLNKWKEDIDEGIFDEYLQALSLTCAAEEISVCNDNPQARSRKGALLLEAAQKLIALFNSGNASIATAMTYVRVMNHLGKRKQALEMVKELMETMNSGGTFSVELPFLLPLTEQDETDIETDFSKWLTVRIVEAWIILQNPTMYLIDEKSRKMLEALRGNPEASSYVEKLAELASKAQKENKNLISRDSAYKNENNYKKNDRESAQSISLVGEVSEYNETPSQVIRTKINLHYLSNGNPYYFDIPKRELFRLKNIVLDHEYALPKNFKIKNDGVIVDIGANIGTFAMYARHWNSNAMIYCFEPNPQVVQLLKFNTKDIENVEKEFIALGEDDGELTLLQHPVNTGQSTTSQKVKGAKEVTVEVKNAGRALKEKGIEAIDVLKIDTEGAEIPILKGMKKLLDKTKVIMLEYHTEEDRREIDALLHDFCIYSTEVAKVNGVGTVKYINKHILR
ncbi:hypothetical protein CK503_07290 [Aliifodinibius salipaludis]|uniref:protein O-GlcNAc transferase n=1 Tax=Fodinibius salipaludis TaxID=2032627 RepID=A0A2A2GCJ6_9BACT|nr:FkbM family methyltransferase [Aliifodinibius salipaludis]PAU94589.1 hypothetical protein CK503_07290 [Aliifodinibius salipaludis]